MGRKNSMFIDPLLAGDIHDLRHYIDAEMDGGMVEKKPSLDHYDRLGASQRKTRSRTRKVLGPEAGEFEGFEILDMVDEMEE